LATFSIARLTYLEALRQPVGLVLTMILAILALFAPSFTAFSLGQGLDLLRSNLLSSLMVGGVIFASLLSTDLIGRDLQRKSLLTILSRPVGIPSYYLGKWLGIAALILHFLVILVGVGWMAMTVGTPDTASSVHNFIPLYTLGAGLGAVCLLALVLNYAFDLPIISFIYGGWALWTPVTILITLILSPVFGLPVPGAAESFQFVLASLLVGSMILVMASFSMALSTVTSAIPNMVLSLIFLFLALMGPGLESMASQVHPWLSALCKVLPDFHLLWTADWLSLGSPIPLGHLVGGMLYSLTLMASFSFLGVHAMMNKEFC